MKLQYIESMDSDEWTRRCAGRLREEWPDLPEDELFDAAAVLWAAEKWRRFGPEVAAVAWLRQGVVAKQGPIRSDVQGSAGGA